MIITVPNKILTTPAKAVKKIDRKILQVVSQMKKALEIKEDPKGVGLAAPQIGVPLRLFLTRPTETSKVEVFLNPEITWRSEELGEIERPEGTKGKPSFKRDKKLEGCLSIPNIWGRLMRPKKVRLKYMDINGNWQEKEFTGFMATIVQHETDHVNGILFTQRVLEQKEKLYEIEEDAKGNEKLVEIHL